MRAAAVASLVLFLMALSYSAMSEGSEKWVTSWAASAQGPYPSGNSMMQPDLRRAFPAPEAGARDQSFRLIVGPDIWGHEARIRLSNAFGTKAVTFDGVFVGLQLDSSAIVPGTNRPVTFAGRRASPSLQGQAFGAIPSRCPSRALFPGPSSGEEARSQLPCRRRERPHDVACKGSHDVLCHGARRGLARRNEDEAAFPYGTTSWYFLDAVDMKVHCRYAGHRGAWRLDHRRHRLDIEWRRSLAGCAFAAAPCKIRRQILGGECRDRRQPDRGAA